MFSKAQTFFLGSCFATGLVIYQVHKYQQDERDRVRVGVYKDFERRSEKSKLLEDQELNNQQKKLSNLQLLKEQVNLEKSLSQK